MIDGWHHRVGMRVCLSRRVACLLPVVEEVGSLSAYSSRPPFVSVADFLGFLYLWV